MVANANPPPPDGRRPDSWTDFRWVFGLVAAGLGLLALLRTAVGRPGTAPTPEPPPGPEPTGPLPEEVHHPDGTIEHPSVRFERTDVYHRAVLIVFAAVLCIFALEFYAVWQFFLNYDAHESAIKQSPYPLAPKPPDRLPAEPRLEQVDRMAKVETPNVFLREEAKEKILDSTGPTAERGFVHIPIERAMKLVVKQLPVRKQAHTGPAKDNGLVDSGEPNSGRLFRKGRR